MSTAQPHLAIIIVNWNSAEFLRACVSSIYAHIKNLDFEIIVVDNASYDGSGPMLARDFPKAVFIQSDQNLGFARANNLGFTRSKAPFIVFLNPDTELLGPALYEMLKFIETTPLAGVVGARLLNSDHSVQTSCVQRFPTIINRVIDADILRRLTSKSRFWGTQPLFENAGKTDVVEVVSGACQMVRRDVFEKIGMFEESFFMYAEDADLCFKANKAGFKNYFVGEAVIVHHGAQSSTASSEGNFAAVVMRESLCRMFALRHGRLYAASYRASVALVALFRLGLLWAVMCITFRRFRTRAIAGAAKKWMKVLRWSIGLEPWVSCPARPRNLQPTSDSAI